MVFEPLIDGLLALLLDAPDSFSFALSSCFSNVDRFCTSNALFASEIGAIEFEVSRVVNGVYAGTFECIQVGDLYNVLFFELPGRTFSEVVQFEGVVCCQFRFCQFGLKILGYA